MKSVGFCCRSLHEPLSIWVWVLSGTTPGSIHNAQRIMVNMVTTDGESARRPSFSSAGRSGSTGPCVRFEGIRLELSSFAGCSFDFAKDGSLVLSFSNFSGSVTLRSNSGRGTSSHDGLAHPLCSTSSEAGSLGVLDAEHAMEIDMALSQLEQESPKSGMSTCMLGHCYL